MRLRQVALVARELEPTVDALCDVLGIEVAFNDPDVAVFGLRNAVMPIGDTFLEVVSPSKPGTTAGRLLERRRGDGGYMVIVQSQDKQADRARMGELGVRIAWEAQLERAGTLHLHPRDVGGAILSLDWMDPEESWWWAGPRWRECVRTDVSGAIAGVEIQAEDPAGMARRWSEVLAAPLRAQDGDPVIAFDGGGSVRFGKDRDGRGDGVAGLVIAARDAAGVRERARARGALRPSGAIELCGMRIALA
jgi:hypothetical protein